MTKIDFKKEIEISEHTFTAEIRSKSYGGSITVYRPRRDEFPSGQRGPAIEPGYINASSWGMCGIGADTPVGDVQRACRVWRRMQEVAYQLLNRYNEVLLDWEPIPDEEEPEGE